MQTWLTRLVSPLLAVSALAMCGGADGNAATSPTPQAGGTAGPWQLSWTDDFDGPDGSRPDPSRWVLELWVNLYAADYGGFGVVMAFFFWIAFSAFTVVASATLAPVLAERRRA